MAQAKSPLIYRIEVAGRLDPSWSDWFEEMTIITGQIADGRPVTVITGPVRDQAALQGILTRLWNLNLPLLAVNCIDENVRSAMAAPKEEK